MSRRLFVAALVLPAIFLALPGSRPVAQMRVETVTSKQGVVALELELRKLRSIGTFMMTTAHPDDENNALLAWMGLGQGMRTVLVSATRGDGGQNEIGPELFDALAVLRTTELEAAHRFDGAEQFYTRAVDFGYSFSIDETYAKWGQDETVGDFVRLIRTTRPDVVTGFIWEGTGGGQHHQASARITAEAYRAAADPARYPGQIKEGLRPWQAKKLYVLAGFGWMGRGRAPQPAVPVAGMLTVDAGVYDPLLGRTYAEIGIEARSMHKCQGTTQQLLLPGGQFSMRYRLQETTIPGQLEKVEASMFDGIDVSFARIVDYAGAASPDDLKGEVAAIAGHVEAAGKALASGRPADTAPSLAAGLSAVRSLRERLGTMGLTDAAAFEIGFRLTQKQKQFERALALAHGLRVEALADDGVVVRGQAVKTAVIVAARGGPAVRVTDVHPTGFDGYKYACPPADLEGGRAFECTVEAQVPPDAAFTSPYFQRRTDAARYDFEPDAPFGLPFRPTPFRVAVDVEMAGEKVVVEVPVQYRYDGAELSGEKRMELNVVPSIAARVSPEIAVVPRSAAGARVTPTRGATSEREVRVTVKNGARGPAAGEVRLEAPPGWTAKPALSLVSFLREDDEATVRFTLRPPTGVPAGRYSVRARVSLEGRDYREGYQVIEYPHTTRQHVLQAAEVPVLVLDVEVAPGLRVGYVMGVGDQVPAALQQLGANVTLLDSDELAWGDLSRYDVIVTGVRAYERRADLRANNHRLLTYAGQGGTVIVQYNKFEFNEAQYGPFAAKVSTNRVTDERAPVRVLVPSHPVFRVPNPIADETWSGWVQERGLYFLGDRDERYIDLVETEDPFEYNKGPKRGALVEAPVGKGRWLYVGLGLWRQLPAGTPGAYRLMANLLSLGKSAPASR